MTLDTGDGGGSLQPHLMLNAQAPHQLLLPAPSVEHLVKLFICPLYLKQDTYAELPSAICIGGRGREGREGRWPPFRFECAPELGVLMKPFCTMNRTSTGRARSKRNGGAPMLDPE